MSITGTRIDAPVGLQEVHTLLGVGKHNGSYDLAYICSNRHGKTNRWSLKKPIAVANHPQALTPQEWLDHDYGYTIPTYATYGAMKQAAGASWAYNPPVPGTHYSRLTDWEGYNHAATCPYALEVMNSSPRLDGTCQLAAASEVSRLLEWGKWQSFQGTHAQYLNCGIHVPGVGYYPLTDTDQGQTILELDSSKLTFSTPSDRFQTGKQYEAYLVLTTWDGMDGPRRWYDPGNDAAANWWLVDSGTPAAFSCLPAYTPMDQFSIMFSDTYTKLTLQGADHVFTDTRFTAVAGMGEGYSGTAQLSVEFHVTGVYDGSSTLKDILIGTMSATLAGGDEARQTIAYAGQLRFIAAREHLTVEARIVLKEGSKMYQQTRTFSIEASVV